MSTAAVYISHRNKNLPEFQFIAIAFGPLPENAMATESSYNDDQRERREVFLKVRVPVVNNKPPLLVRAAG